MKKIVALVLLVAVVSFITFSILKLLSARNTKTLIVGTDATYAPMEFISEGKVTGYDVDFINALAKETNYKIEVKNIAWDKLFSSLENQEIDMIVSAVTINPERQQKYAFSKPYFNAGQVVVTKSSSQIAKVTDLNSKNLAVQVDTTSATEALKITSSSNILSVQNYDEAISALENDKVAAIIIDLPAAYGLINRNKNLKIVGDPFTQEYYGIVFEKTRTDLAEEFNQAIDKFRNSADKDALYEKYFRSN